MMFECTFLPQSVFGRLERSRPVIIQPKQNTNNNKKKLLPQRINHLWAYFVAKSILKFQKSICSHGPKKKSLLIAYRRKFCTSFHFRRILWLLEHKSNGCDCWFCSLHSPKNHYTAVYTYVCLCVCFFPCSFWKFWIIHAIIFCNRT